MCRVFFTFVNVFITRPLWTFLHFMITASAAKAITFVVETCNLRSRVSYDRAHRRTSRRTEKSHHAVAMALGWRTCCTRTCSNSHDTDTHRRRCITITLPAVQLLKINNKKEREVSHQLTLKQQWSIALKYWAGWVYIRTCYTVASTDSVLTTTLLSCNVAYTYGIDEHVLTRTRCRR